MNRRSIRVMLAGGAALMLPGCVPTEMSGNKGNAETSIYYASQAEADARRRIMGKGQVLMPMIEFAGRRVVCHAPEPNCRCLNVLRGRRGLRL